jgi:sec-independent protein translocase protein TatA
MGIGSRELIIFLVIVLIIFGPKNLPKLAQAIGRSVRELKNGMAGLSEDVNEAAHGPTEKKSGVDKHVSSPAAASESPKDTVETAPPHSPKNA